MSFSLEELNPSKPTIHLSNGDVEFSLIDLYLTVRLNELYGSVHDAVTMLSTNPKALYSLCFLFVDKNKFSSVEQLIRHLHGSDKNTLDITRALTRAFHESVTRSMPIVKNKRIKNAFDEINADDDRISCYGKFYDLIAKRYGYTIDEFMRLTVRQLHIILECANDGEYDDISVQAKLNGKEMKPRIKPIEVDDETDEALDRDALEMLRVQKEKYEKGKLNG